MKTKLDIIKENPSVSNDDIGRLFEKEGYTTGTSESSVRRLKKQNNIASNHHFVDELRRNKFDSDNWTHGWLKTDTASIFIKNDEGFITYDEIREELLHEIKTHAPVYPKIKRRKITDGHLLVIDPADVHIGKLALLEETGENYNLKIAEKRCIDGVNGIIEKAHGFPIERILLVIGNDILHRDNPQNTTSAGTRQDVSGMWWQAYLIAKRMYIGIIENLLTIAPVEVVFCPSNHDYASGFMLADSLSSWFHHCPDITFKTDIIHRKYVRYGLSMLCFDHADGAKEVHAKDLMADEQPKMWAATKFRYCYRHHFHHFKKVKWHDGEDYIGVTVEYLRSPTAADSWHHKNGYLAPKAVEGFIHHPKYGQVAKLVHYFV